MKNIMSKQNRIIKGKYLHLLTLLMLTASCSNKFLNVEKNTGSLEAYEKFELTFELPKTYNNPFDFNEIEVSARFTNPDGKKIEVPGF